ncbi:DUF3515 domain-containing protein [Streptomyces sp. URMC 127]|uniref:DUF3515 domain-containing protein n=1 Tax=Streptomyces sp. URMC 127 TaxID=3423402 RepID=UPI003F1E0808
MKSFLRRPFRLPAVVVLCAAAGCSPAGGTEGPSVPTPSARAAGLCRALHKELPKTVDGKRRRTADPVSDFTAVWGDPAIALRCGVERPEIIKPGSEHYNPAADSVEIDGVDWLPERQPDGSVRCTTTLREAFVEVTLPKQVVGGAGDLGALTDLAGAVAKTIPVGVV